MIREKTVGFATRIAEWPGSEFSFTSEPAELRTRISSIKSFLPTGRTLRELLAELHPALLVAAQLDEQMLSWNMRNVRTH